MHKHSHATAIAVILLITKSSYTLAAVQDDINAACINGGVVNMPSTLSLSTTLNLICAPGSKPVALRGAPTTITCPSAMPCISVGSTDTVNETGSRLNLSLSNVLLSGHGRSDFGSEGIRVLPTADEAVIDHVRIDGFETGMHLIGGKSLLHGVRVSYATISPIWTTSVTTAVHLDGPIGDAFFDNFALSAWERAIVADGEGKTGAAASFVNGYINMTKTPGIPAVYVTSSDASIHILLLADIQDWETACPYAEVGYRGNLTLNGVAFNGDPQSSGMQPGIKVSGDYSYLRISNATLNYCSGHGDLIDITSALSFTSIVGSDLLGPANFVAQGRGAFSGNRWNGCPVGNLTLVRAMGNLGCPDH